MSDCRAVLLLRRMGEKCDHVEIEGQGVGAYVDRLLPHLSIWSVLDCRKSHSFLGKSAGFLVRRALSVCHVDPALTARALQICFLGLRFLTSPQTSTPLPTLRLPLLLYPSRQLSRSLRSRRAETDRDQAFCESPKCGALCPASRICLIHPPASLLFLLPPSIPRLPQSRAEHRITSQRIASHRHAPQRNTTQSGSTAKHTPPTRHSPPPIQFQITINPTSPSRISNPSSNLVPGLVPSLAPQTQH